MAGGTLTSGSWSVAGLTSTGTTGKIHENTYIKNKQRTVMLKLSLACGAIARGGLALPGAGSVGMVRSLQGYILHHVCSAATARLVTGITTQNRFFTLNTTGNKIYAMTSVITSGTTVNSFQPLGTGTEIAPHKFYCSAFGW